ncbi:hypothetical protein VCRA2122O12_100071 [Vibrio crassostreae]|nr:hypothetical protein VCRA2117O328_10356 [Vibrio crassostreae]CAK2483038.1 hypothetical protein VCRA2110O319_30068 [Vibrio crassostreae]CAK2535396.1 hypothetical protein VCRA2110O3_110071 [Vibrio crassostreae]CAK2555037.1 hypothetical protein VCRA2110O2_130070 [Vibrio crassostreae]CAK2684205.1 hypothetical protein VCRA2127O15_120071 [Vibrio crassostreae]
MLVSPEYVTAVATTDIEQNKYLNFEEVEKTLVK